MTIWAIADLHLSFGTKNKTMEVFGDDWFSWTEKLQKNWKEKVANDDLVLIPGDLSWAMNLQEVEIDLNWIDNLPGTKLLIKGNHDYWWSSTRKVKEILPSSIQIISNDAFVWQEFAIAGTRLWDCPEIDFAEAINFSNEEYDKQLKATKENEQKNQKIWERELIRLELSLKQIPHSAKRRIAMTHFPPIGVNLFPTKASSLMKQYGIELCVFGHLHNVKKEMKLFGEKEGITYLCVSCDYLNFSPLKIFP